MLEMLTVRHCPDIHVLPCKLCVVCAAQSICGFLQESADHLRMIILISDTILQKYHF